MAEVLIIYYSRSGNTEKMAKLVEEGVRAARSGLRRRPSGLRGAGVEVETKRVEDVKLDELLEPAGIIMGSPTYYGSMAAELKRLLDESPFRTPKEPFRVPRSVKYHGKLARSGLRRRPSGLRGEGKVGGAFSSSGGIGGGNETTVLDILKSLLVHGMVVQGTSQGDHYGPVAVGAPDERSAKNCRRLGERVAALVKKLYG